MLMSISFSVIVYNAVPRQFDRQIPTFTMPNSPLNNSPTLDTEIKTAIESRFKESRADLAVAIVWFNLIILAVGGILSYFLARRTLRPIVGLLETQSQFISDASHELRTPLTVIQTTNEVMLRKKRISDKDARRLISYTIEETEKLKSLSDTLLELLKDDNQRINFEVFNIQEALADSLSYIVDSAQKKGITISDTVDSMDIYTNRLLFTKILSILLDNAVKYSDTNKTIEISSGVTGKFVQISVTDEGYGIKASDLPHIFRRFYRADKSRNSTTVPGYGLGLAIADKIAKEAGVKLQVSSTVGIGSTFTIIVPIARQRSAIHETTHR